MNNWVKIQTFDRIHQAELRKDILMKNNINSVIINEKDSLFLLGEIELYVENKNEKLAKALIDEFKGLTKINSFIDMKPIILFQKVLKNAGIESTLTRAESEKYSIGNYELYINNEDLEKAIPFLTGEKMTDRKAVKTCQKVRQAKLFVDLLSENLINSITIKKKDSEYHLEKITIYTKIEDSEKATKIMSELNGYNEIFSTENVVKIEKQEELLAKNNIKAFIIKDSKIYKLFVAESKTNEAKEIISSEINWLLVKEFSNIASAMYHKSILDTANIASIILNEQDSSFLLGEIELFVSDDDFKNAKEILDNL
jgi:hypothetical protein